MRGDNHGLSIVQLSTGWILGILLIPTVALFSAIALQPWIPVAHLVRDPLVVAEEAATCCSVYYGVLSNLGVILWIVTATACLLVGILVRFARAAGSRAAFFLAGGLFSLWLGLDDFFMVHEDVLPVFGVPQPVTYAIYAATGAAYLAFAWRHVLQGRVSLFGLAGLCLGASMGLDAIVHSEEAFWIFLEDGLKFTGIALWAGFHVAAALEAAAGLIVGKVTAVALSSGQLMREKLQPAG